MFEKIRYDERFNCIMNRSEDDVRYYFDCTNLWGKVNIKCEDGCWWEPESVENYDFKL